MRNFVKWLFRWLMDDLHYDGIVLSRIILGLTFFFCYLLRAPYVAYLYGPDGLGGINHHQQLFRHLSINNVPHTISNVPHTMWLGHQIARIDSIEWVWALFVLLLVSALCFACGFFTRTAGCMTLLLHIGFRSHATATYWSWSVMIQPLMLYAILAPTGRYFSLDAWLRSRRKGGPAWNAVGTGPAWPVRLFQIHICCMYAVAGWSRVDRPDWLAGEMLFAALFNTKLSRLYADWITVKGLLEILCYPAFILEPLAPVVLWFKRVGKWWALGLIALHVVLEVTTLVGWWNATMLSGLVLFLPRSWQVGIRTGWGRVRDGWCDVTNQAGRHTQA